MNHSSMQRSRTGKKGPYAAYYVHFQPGACFVGEYLITQHVVRFFLDSFTPFAVLSPKASILLLFVLLLSLGFVRFNWTHATS